MDFETIHHTRDVILCSLRLARFYSVMLHYFSLFPSLYSFAVDKYSRICILPERIKRRTLEIVDDLDCD